MGLGKYFNVNAEGCSICCKLYADDPAVIRTVVLCGHGFGGNRDNRSAERFAERLISKNKGVAVIAFDWPCHGSDVRKTLRLEDCSEYLRLMIGFIRATYAPERLFAYATSFGGYLFLRYISEEGSPFDAVALRCPAVKMYETMTSTMIGEDDLARIEKGKPVTAGFDRKIKIDAGFMEQLKREDITGRDFTPFADEMLIIQGSADELVAPEPVERFADDNCIICEIVEGADHVFHDPVKMDKAIAMIASFFDLK